MIKNKSIIVSVCMLTYKHDKYIKESIESVLNQLTNYKIELIIANDCSPDNTDNIIKDIINTHPRKDLIRYYRHEQNIGMYNNLDFILKKTNGEYIAFCEGDDYWTDINKINKQIETFLQNPNIGLIHHDSNYLYEKRNILFKDFHKKNKIKVSNGRILHELLEHNNILTPTVMFKSDLLKYYNDIDKNISLSMADYPMWLSYAPYTDFYYIPESMSTYRVLENSASHFSNFKKEIDFLDSYYNIKQYFINKYCLKNFNPDLIVNYYTYKKLQIFSKYNRNEEVKSLRHILMPKNINQKFIKYFSKFPIILKIYYRLINIYLKNY
jgi:glycosyltransferase involved in cell wall biosynthesis